MIEEGDLASARERLQRAQDRLDEAIRNGADPSEIDELMQELREALDNYMRELAEEAQRNPDSRCRRTCRAWKCPATSCRRCWKNCSA
jgi:histone H3/H4